MGIKMKEPFLISQERLRLFSKVFQTFTNPIFPAHPKKCLQHQHITGVERIIIQATKFFIVLAYRK
jgi:hypothetical protein